MAIRDRAQEARRAQTKGSTLGAGPKPRALVTAAAGGSMRRRASDGPVQHHVGMIREQQCRDLQSIAFALQAAIAEKIFAQSQRFDAPTESGLALTSLSLLNSAPATKDRQTDLACQFRECGWSLLRADNVGLHQLKNSIDRVLQERTAGKATN
jgi:hypothetical protein